MDSQTAAMIREKDAEISYLRQRNLALSIAVENLSRQIAETMPQEEITDETEQG